MVFDLAKAFDALVLTVAVTVNLYLRIYIRLYTQCVKIADVMSGEYSVDFGVPQGIIIGPSPLYK